MLVSFAHASKLPSLSHGHPAGCVCGFAGRAPKDIKASADEKGDLGVVAETSRASQKTLFGSLGLAKPSAGSTGG
jgi:hypothetical protein